MKNLKLILISNNKVNQEQILSKLRGFNYNVDILNFQESLKYTKNEVILVDEKIGYENIKYYMTKKITDTDNESRVILISHSKDIEKYINIDIDDYIYIDSDDKEFDLKIKINNNKIKTYERIHKKLYIYKEILESIPYPIWIQNLDGKYTYCNKDFEKKSSKGKEYVYGKSSREIWGIEMDKVALQNDQYIMDNNVSMVYSQKMNISGGNRQLKIHKAPIIDKNKETVAIIGIATDITELKNKDTKLQMLIDNIPFGIWMNDMNGNYVNVNKQFAKTLNTSAKDMIGTNVDEYLDADEVYKIKKEDIQIYESKKGVLREEAIYTDEGTRNIEVYKNPILNIDKEIIGITGAVIDVTDLKKAKNEAKTQAYTDWLTKLYNRRCLYDYMDKINKNKSIGIIMLDIDDFKEINDKYGHNIGDEALIYVSRVIKEICEDCFIARLGGDEFIIIIEDIDKEQNVCNKANEIIDKIKEDNLKEQREYEIKLSLGIMLERNNNNVEELIRRADLALYKAKENGKNQVVEYTKDLEIEKAMIMNIQEDIKKAINNNEIDLYYQPQYDKQNNISGFEALFRWKNKSHQHIPTKKIIEIIEENKLIIDIGYYIIQKACMFSTQINKVKEQYIISINISPTQLIQEDFVDKVKEIVKYTNVNPKTIGLEITESILIDDTDKNIKKIEQLKELGFNIYIDDFGTGYSSLGYLVKLPITALKIDKSFINKISDSIEYQKLVNLIIDLAHSLGLLVVAEGIETKKQLSILNKLKVDYIQGHYYSRAVCEEEALKMINSNIPYLENLEKMSI